MSRGKSLSVTIFVILLGFVGSQSLHSHCQVPCGIYDDAARIKMIAEHIATIEKAMNQVIELSQQAKPNYNQIVRWVTNKEKHAEELSQIITYYFMAQRIKMPTTEKEQAGYRDKLQLLHHLLVYTMQAKQSTDLSVIETLKKYLGKFEELYFKKK